MGTDCVRIGDFYYETNGSWFPFEFASTTTRVIQIKPKKIIFNPPAKTVVKCENDDFSEEFGYAMAVMRKIYGSRAAFKNVLKSAIRTKPSPKKQKNCDSAENIADFWEEMCID